MAVFVPLFALILFITTSSYACEPYDRKAWKHWVDEDRDCQNARHEVLIEESLTPVTFKTDKGCRVVSGNWLGKYSGDVFTDASKLDIDHLVPLKEAHESGGFAWDTARRRDYANDLSDPNTLIAVDRGLNRQKGAKDPAEWMPPNKAYQTEYTEAWVTVKRRWGLTADAKEIAALQAILGTEAEMPMMAEECAGTMTSEQVPTAQVDCQAKRYCTQMKTCEEARAYLTQCKIQILDRDRDGKPCESLCR